MHNTVHLYCPNPSCQALNPESHSFCQQCSTPLPKRYLWVIGKDAAALQPGELLGGRYWVKQHRIVLDTQPGSVPESPEEVPLDLEPYLRLFPYQLHVPQIYGAVNRELTTPETTDRILFRLSAETLWLLERAPIYPAGLSQGQTGGQEATLQPDFLTCWPQASALRQLNWLRQLARLWWPLKAEAVASTLLTPELLHVDGSLVRLRQLERDTGSAPSLVDLGRFWQTLQERAQPQILPFFTALCQELIQGHIETTDQILAVLDRGLMHCGSAQSRYFQFVTQTDQGPSRSLNEDACFPPSGTIWSLADPGAFPAAPGVSTESVPLVIVCDGIGGHEGGEVASNRAIAVIQQQLCAALAQTPASEPSALIDMLQAATLVANDAITRQNDAEHREERQRMGTTLVMALVQAQNLYVTHVGDSRAYLVTRTGCHQVTLDDDLAAREVRLGYTLYRQALQNPGSGSLVQALGMNASFLLHPSVLPLVLDEDCLLLLCSDGLSDNDRVEQYWPTELLPVLEGKTDVGSACRRLVAIANTTNGHDNVTVGLIHCQVSPRSALPQPVVLDAALATPPPPLEAAMGDADTSATTLMAAPSATGSPVIETRQRSLTLPFLLGLAAFLGLLGLLAYGLSSGLRPFQSGQIPVSPMPTDSVSPLPSPSAEAPLAVGSLVQIVRGSDAFPTVALLRQPGQLPTPAIAAQVPVGSVLQIVSRQVLPGGGDWLKLKLCSVPPGAPTSFTAGASGWIEQAAIAPLVTQNLSLTASQLGSCAPNVSPSPSPTPFPAKVRPSSAG